MSMFSSNTDQQSEKASFPFFVTILLKKEQTPSNMIWLKVSDLLPQRHHQPEINSFTTTQSSEGRKDDLIMENINNAAIRRVTQLYDTRHEPTAPASNNRVCGLRRPFIKQPSQNKKQKKTKCRIVKVDDQQQLSHQSAL